jgi:hypothetical protein
VEVEKSPASPLPIFWGKILVNFLCHKIGEGLKKRKKTLDGTMNNGQVT